MRLLLVALGLAVLTQGIPLGSPWNGGTTTPNFAGNGSGMPITSTALQSADSVTVYNAYLPNGTITGNTVILAIRYQTAGSTSGSATLTQRTQNDSCANGTTCNFTAATTTAGTAVICFANNLASGQSLSSCTDGGDTFVACSTSCNGSDATSGALDMRYVLSGAGSKTSITCNISGSPGHTWTCGIYELKTTTSGWTFDASNNVDRSTAAATQTGVSLTLTGSCDSIVRISNFSTGGSTVSGGYTFIVDGHTNIEASLLGTTSGTGPTYTLTSSGTMAEGALALKEGAGCTNALAYERPTWSDNIGGNTYHVITDANDSTNSVVYGLWYVQPTSGVQKITATFATGTKFVQVQPYEFYNVGAVDQSATNSGSGTSITGGTLATLAATGDLIFHEAFVVNNTAITSWTKGSQSNITWNLRSAMEADNYGSMIQWGVYSATASFAPASTVSTSVSWDSAAVAFKQAAAGAAPGSGIRVVYAQHDNTETEQITSITLQAPISGNALVVLANSGCSSNTLASCNYITAVSDGTNTYSEPCAALNNGSVALGGAVANVWLASGVSPATYSITYTMNSRPSSGHGSTFWLYDISGANSSPLDSSFGTSGCATSTFNQTTSSTTLTTFTATPSAQNEVILSQVGAASSSFNGFSTPSAALFQACNYTTETNSSHCDLNAGLGHFYNGTSTAAETWTWTDDNSSGSGVGLGIAQGIALHP